MDVATDSAINIDINSIITELQIINDTVQANHADICDKLKFLEGFEVMSGSNFYLLYIISGVLLFFTVCFVIYIIYKLFRIFF